MTFIALLFNSKVAEVTGNPLNDAGVPPLRRDAPAHRVETMADRIMPPGFPAPTGPWSPGVKAKPGEMLFIAGCVSIDDDGKVVGAGDVAAQTHQLMKNFQRVVAAAGMKMSDVVKITNYLVDVRDYPAMSAVRQQYLQEPFPASTMVEVTGFLYPGLLVEIEGIAIAS